MEIKVKFITLKKIIKNKVKRNFKYENYFILIFGIMKCVYFYFNTHGY